jgi:hypothetical protein
MDGLENLTAPQIDAEIEALQQKEPWAKGDEAGTKRLSELLSWQETKRSQASVPGPVQGFRPVREMSAQDLELEIRELMDASGPWGKGITHPRYRATMMRLEELHRARYPILTPDQKRAEGEKFKQEVEAQEEKNRIRDETDTIKKATEQLKTLWGPDFQANIDLADEIVEHFLSEEEREEFIRLGHNNDPEMIDLIYRLGQKLISSQKGYKLSK